VHQTQWVRLASFFVREIADHLNGNHIATDRPIALQLGGMPPTSHLVGSEEGRLLYYSIAPVRGNSAIRPANSIKPATPGHRRRPLEIPHSHLSAHQPRFEAMSDQRSEAKCSDSFSNSLIVLLASSSGIQFLKLSSDVVRSSGEISKMHRTPRSQRFGQRSYMSFKPFRRNFLPTDKRTFKRRLSHGQPQEQPWDHKNYETYTSRDKKSFPKLHPIFGDHLVGGGLPPTSRRQDV